MSGLQNQPRNYALEKIVEVIRQHWSTEGERWPTYSACEGLRLQAIYLCTHYSHVSIVAKTVRFLDDLADTLQELVDEGIFGEEDRQISELRRLMESTANVVFRLAGR